MVNNPEEHHLQHCLGLLKKNNFIEYTGEFGAEITTFIPFVAWLKANGHLKGCRIKTYVGMQPYYFFLGEDEYEEKEDLRRWLPIEKRFWPSNSTYHAVQSPFHVYTDYRHHYVQSGERFDRPLIFMQNKFNIEWNAGPINFMPLNGLKKFFNLTQEKFTLFYSRPGARSNKNYTKDHNLELNYPDMEIVAQYPHVVNFEDYCANLEKNYNVTKLEILAKSNLYAAVQGGGAHLLACFSDALMLLLDRSEDLSKEGREYPHAYKSGPYKYLSNPPPQLMVARTFSSFNAGLNLLSQVDFVEDKMCLTEEMKTTLESLRL